jgi:hypothetical protein
MLRNTIIAGAVAVLPLCAQAQTTTYSFFGYVPCSGGAINGCSMDRGHGVRFTFGNGLTAAECLQYQETSIALTGMGFCNPPIK